MDSRARRIGENEVLFRHVNVHILSLDEKLDSVTGEQHAFLRECGRVECSERVSLTLEDYERIHEDPAQFAMIDGHEEPSVEDVVERRGGYAVVRKRRGGPAELAEQHSGS